MSDLTIKAKGLTLGPFELAPTKLIVHGRPSFDEWQRVGPFLRYVE